MSECKHEWQPISLMGLSGAKCAKCGMCITANAPTMCETLKERDRLAERVRELEGQNAQIFAALRSETEDSIIFADHRDQQAERARNAEARVGELEAALRAVAEEYPVVEAGGVAQCGLCGGRDRHSKDGRVRHLDCPWVAARKLVGMEAE